MFFVLGTLFLIFAGAEVKSREAGLSVPDWPLSYGRIWPKMVGGVFYEHGHRTVATVIGLLTIVLAVWIQRSDPRRWMRRLGWFALVAVCLQGLLGGLTVKYKLPPAISMSHGTLAQMFLCLAAWIAYASSREFEGGVQTHSGQPTVAARLPSAWRAVRVALACVFVQLLLGAWVRHSEAGLAVPFYPLSDTGSLLPEYTNRLVWIHMTHRVFAVVVFLAVWRAVLAAVTAVPALLGHGAFLAGLLFLQGVLGATVVWVEKAPFMTSLHVMNGAAVLVTTWVLVLRTWRARAELQAGTSAATAAARPACAPTPRPAPSSQPLPSADAPTGAVVETPLAEATA